MNADRIPSLDGLRGIAAWLVVASHANNNLPERLAVFGGAGQAGVMIFFVLSGFLMGHLYARTPASERIGLYANHRIARVIPLYLAVVGFSYYVQVITPELRQFVHAYNVDSENIWQHLLLVKGQNVLWTIPVECTFYALFAGLWFARQRSMALYAILAAGLAIAAIGLQFKPLPTGHELPKYLLYFLAGLVAADVYASRTIRQDTWSSYGGAVIAGVCLLLLIPGIYRIVFSAGLGGYEGYMPLLLALVIVTAAAHSHLLHKLLGNPLMKLQGDISYSVYLLHPLLMYSMKKTFGLDGYALFFAVFPVTFVAACISFYAFERPAGRAIRSLARKRTKTVTA